VIEGNFRVELRDRRDTYNGFGEALSRAVELVVTPLIFGLLGYALDRGLGTVPVFAVVLSLFALCGMGVRVWFSYDHAMRAHEAAGPWAKHKAVR
jgi:F0F1-type ATP synthase assembly protein I